MNPNYNSKYNQNYTWAEVEEILSQIKNCVAEDLNLEVHDFCYSLNNKNKRYQPGPLYVFMPQVSVLNCACQEAVVDLYIKISIVEQESGTQIIVISFHERNHPPMYLFR